MNLVNKIGCKFLRAKNAYGTMEGGDDPMLPSEEGTTNYWCILSCSPVGPDNLPAFTSSCTKIRTCFTPLQKVEDTATQNSITLPKPSIKS